MNTSSPSLPKQLPSGGEYLLLIQPSGGKARVEHHAPNAGRRILFEGGRVEAKRFLRGKAVEIAWESVPQFNQPVIQPRKNRFPELRQIHPQ